MMDGAMDLIKHLEYAEDRRWKYGADFLSSVQYQRRHRIPKIFFGHQAPTRGEEAHGRRSAAAIDQQANELFSLTGIIPVNVNSVATTVVTKSPSHQRDGIHLRRRPSVPDQEKLVSFHHFSDIDNYFKY